MSEPLPLGNFELGGRRFAGQVSGERVRELPVASTADLFDDWETNARRVASITAGPEHELASLQILPPVQPRQILQAGANYREHVVGLVVAQGRRSRGDAERIMDERHTRSRARTRNRQANRRGPLGGTVTIGREGRWRHLSPPTRRTPATVTARTSSAAAVGNAPADSGRQRLRRILQCQTPIPEQRDVRDGHPPPGVEGVTNRITLITAGTGG